mmetsp:Transcript_31425/g.96085  ORF Transcript_31425/g.96085 Transcript_31425/m.96085 type:complete len:268 (-) Transcript_31425:925-1728(-)|eukprot:scaffold218614_cov35-Tisochrysis_lutea.AAC.3
MPGPIAVYGAMPTPTPMEEAEGCEQLAACPGAALTGRPTPGGTEPGTGAELVLLIAGAGTDSNAPDCESPRGCISPARADGSEARAADSFAASFSSFEASIFSAGLLPIDAESDEPSKPGRELPPAEGSALTSEAGIGREVPLADLHIESTRSDDERSTPPRPNESFCMAADVGGFICEGCAEAAAAVLASPKPNCSLEESPIILVGMMTPAESVCEPSQGPTLGAPDMPRMAGSVSKILLAGAADEPPCSPGDVSDDIMGRPLLAP